MSDHRRPLRLSLVVTALGLGVAACSDPAGLRVDVAMGDFKSAVSLKIALSALPGGFVAQLPENPGGATVTTEDVDGDGLLDLVALFPGPFDSGAVSFRVTTGNHDDLTIHGQALAFNQTSLVAGGDGDATLVAGGKGTLSLTLTQRSGGSVGPSTRDTDLLTADADLTVKGPSAGAQASATAVCDLNGDHRSDLVIGLPGAVPNASLGATGAVYVVFGGGTAASPITLSPSDNSQFVLHGQFGGDRLGAAVACADLNSDGVDDLIVTAPNAGGGGQVYVILGRTGFNQISIDLGSTDRLPDATWGSANAGDGFGSALFAGNFGAAKTPEILVSAPGKASVHLLSQLPTPTSTAIVDLGSFSHPTFTGVHAVALGAGDLTGVVGPPDVILGDSTYVASGEIMGRGAVYVFATVPPNGATAYDVTAAGPTGPSTTLVGGPGIQFGAAVLALDTTGRGADLFVGAPTDGDGRGLVYAYEHDTNFLLAAIRNYTTTAKKALDLSDAGAHFGSALAASRSGSVAAPSFRLVVGAPDLTRGARTGAGAAYLLGGGADGQFPILELMYGAALGDHLGTAVAGGQVDAADTIGDLVAVAPFATGADTQSGVLYVRDGR